MRPIGKLASRSRTGFAGLRRAWREEPMGASLRASERWGAHMSRCVLTMVRTGEQRVREKTRSGKGRLSMRSSPIPEIRQPSNQAKTGVKFPSRLASAKTGRAECFPSTERAMRLSSSASRQTGALAFVKVLNEVALQCFKALERPKGLLCEDRAISEKRALLPVSRGFKDRCRNHLTAVPTHCVSWLFRVALYLVGVPADC